MNTVASKSDTLDIGQYNITGIALDSRKVQPGFLFAALKGEKSDGVNFIPQALEAGATVILAPPTYTPPSGTSADFIFSSAPRRDLATLAAQYFQPVPTTLCAVTGTNGKTSVAEYSYQLLTLLEHKTCCLSTISVKPASNLSTGLTTGDVLTNHQILQEFAQQGFTHGCLECSSHGLDQYRTHGLPLKAAGFTNLTQDHLDYHKTMDKYFTAKMKIFTELLASGGTAVLNKASDYYEKAHNICKTQGHTIITYGTPDADLSVEGKTLHAFGKTYNVALPFQLGFQISNLLCAIGIVAGLHNSMENILAALPKMTMVTGRMELAATLPNKAKIYIDYAHTPEGLEIVLEEARKNTATNVNVVFGAGGNRPKDRRIRMGQIAQRKADKAYVVDDNPRDEDPAVIRAEIIEHCPKGENCPDRTAGIEKAIRELAADDILIVCGKGHETTVEIKGEYHHHSDQEAVKSAVNKLTAEGLI